MAHGALHQGFRRGMAVFLQELFVQAAAVDPDPDGNVLALAHLHHRLHPVFPANVAGVDADLRRAAFRCGNGQLVVKMNVRHQGQG